MAILLLVVPCTVVLTAESLNKHTNKQFITVQDRDGNTFYIIIDYDKPLDEEGDQYETYFLNLVDTADLAALAEDSGEEAAALAAKGLGVSKEADS